MLIPLSWLRDYVDIDISVEELADKLTFSGTEVEAIIRSGECPDGVIVAEILEVQDHPDADKLKLCRVNTGAAEFSVVCGADNFEVGDKAAFAPPGTRLPGDLEIQTRKVRGEVSEGMLCAADEIGLSDDHSGIHLMERDAPVGTALSALLPEADTVLRLEVTWNRQDCLSIIGMAREVSALLGKSLKLPDIAYEEAGLPVKELVDIQIEDSERCGRYTARVLTEVSVTESPEWMQRRLHLCGVRPINNIVDITNYVMLECGQPLHAFDYDLVKDRSIVVRQAAAGESMTTLDGEKRDLASETLVIADGGGAVALAGIMGGDGSEIGEGTGSVLLESANFDAAGVHRSSVSLDISSESSHRFERGVDIELADWASSRAVSLLVAHAGGCAAKGGIDVYPGKPDPREVSCRFSRVRDLLGVQIGDPEILAIFQSLGMTAETIPDGSCVVKVPSFRGDIRIEADLIEEVARMHGLDQVPVAMPSAALGQGVDPHPPRKVARCRDQLIGLGLTEIMNYSYVSEDLLKAFGHHDALRTVVLPNPVSSEQSHLRRQLIPQIVESLGRNMSRQVDRAALFEIGRVFIARDGGEIKEEDRVAIGLMGPVGRSGFEARRAVENDEMFLWIKGIVEEICRNQNAVTVSFTPTNDVAMESGWAVELSINGRPCGMLGLISESIRSEWRISGAVGVAELDLAMLVATSLETVRIESVPVYPSVSRDIAIIIDESVRHEEILGAIRSAGPVELTEIILFDIFRNKRIGHGKKSMAYSLIYQSVERTLTDEEVNGYHRSVMDALQGQLDAEIREG
jgi:phenylalanyl-tRNA synthetase beta chain